MNESREILYRLVREKAVLKQDVYHNTLRVFSDFKSVLSETVKDVSANYGKTDRRVEFQYRDQGDFQAEIKIAGDVLVFYMHTNVFQIDKSNAVWKSGYVKDNDDNAYVGIINVYNFLADSFKYQRVSDVGYLIARIFVNKENHYFIQGKRQLGYLYNDFINNILDKEEMRKVVDSALLYPLDFDLLAPPYENLQQVTVEEIQSVTTSTNLATGKRMGFRFGLDEPHI
ncbi:MAG: hypothetical protein ACKOSR_12315 [Flavobacteriales bacterium]